MGKTRIPRAIMYKLCKDAGASRVSRAAAEILAKELEEICFRIARDAIDYAKHAGRITVKVQDIQIAARKFAEK